MVKRTSFLVETDLLEAAADVLGTRGPTETIREALRRTVRQAHLSSLAEWELPEDFPEQLEEMRSPRRVEGE